MTAKTEAPPSPRVRIKYDERSLVRAWFALIGISLRRQARARVMIWVAFGLLLLAMALVGWQTWRDGWSLASERYRYPAPHPALNSLGGLRPAPVGQGNRIVVTYGNVAEQLGGISGMLPFDPMAESILVAGSGSFTAALIMSKISRFTGAIMFGLFLGFLLPVWCLSFATEALGGELESRSLVWLLTRPLPRWSIYLAKYIALLPWALAFTLGGFGLMCLAAGAPGRVSFGLYWPAVALGTLAFTSLFHLFSAITRRPTVVGLVYCFFLETMLGDMPGLMKRASVSFYVRCMIFDAAEQLGVQPDKPSVYLPVSGSTAVVVLGLITVVALLFGAWRFSRAEYRDDAT